MKNLTLLNEQSQSRAENESVTTRGYAIPFNSSAKPKRWGGGTVEGSSPRFLSIIFLWVSGTLAKQKKLFFLSMVQKEEKAITWKLSFLHHPSAVQLESDSK